MKKLLKTNSAKNFNRKFIFQSNEDVNENILTTPENENENKENQIETEKVEKPQKDTKNKVNNVLNQDLDNHNRNREHKDLDKVSEKVETNNVKKDDNKLIQKNFENSHKNIDSFTKGWEDYPKFLKLAEGSKFNIQNYKNNTEVLNKLRLAGREISRKISVDILKYANGFELLKKEFLSLKEEPNELKQKVKKAEIIDKLKNHLDFWKSELAEQIKNNLKEYKKVLEDNLSPKSAENFYKIFVTESTDILNLVEKTFGSFFKVAEQINFDFNGDEVFWDIFPKSILKINHYLSFEDGFFKTKISEWEEALNLNDKATYFLDKKGFFEEDDDKFRKNFTNLQSNFSKSVSKYEKNFHKVYGKVRSDISLLSESDFRGKYSLDKNRFTDILNKHDQQIQYFSEIKNTKCHEKYLDNFLKDFHSENIENRANSLEEIGQWESYEKSLPSIEDSSRNFEDFLQDSSRTQYSYFSLFDLYETFKQYFEHKDRLWRRRSDKAISNLGVSFFGEKTMIGKEFVKKREDNEKERVDEYKSQKNSQYGWDIQDDLYQTNDKDEARACIDLLIEKGFMSWDDWDFWKTLNRLEGWERFRKSDLNLTKENILKKVRESCGIIWSINDFNDWEKSMDSSLKSAQDGFNAEYASYETVDPEARSRIMSDMLKNRYEYKKSGKIENLKDVDPSRYEGFLRQSFEYGKQNGGATYDQRWYFLIHGVNSGLLSRDAIARFNLEFLPSQPLVDFFADKDWHKDGKIVPPNTVGATNGVGWQYQDYQDWAKMLGDADGTFQVHNSNESVRKNQKFIYDVMLSSGNSYGRIGRMSRNGDKFDHDDGALYTGVFSVSDIKILIGRQSNGSPKMTADFWRNVLNEYHRYFHQIVRQIDEGDVEYGDSEGWKEIREKKLKNGIEHFRSSMAIIQSLLGNSNVSGTGSQSTTFNETEWEKENAYSLSANKSKERIHSLAKNFFQDIKDDKKRESYEKLLTYNGIEEGLIKSDDAPREVSSAVTNFIIGSEGKEIIGGTENFLSKLRKYCKENPEGDFV